MACASTCRQPVERTSRSSRVENVHSPLRGKSHSITANTYAIDEFNDLATEAGFRVCYVTDIRSKNNYVTFALEAR